MRRATILFTIAILIAVPAVAQRGEAPGIVDRAEGYLRGLELAERLAPAWAVREDRPIFRFVQLADIHWTPRRTALLRDAMAAIVHDVRPAFVVLTGDNISVRGLEGQRALKALLDEGLAGVEVHVLRGDNDSRDFEAVFGSSVWSLDHGGLHLVGIAMDADVEGKGIGTFRDDTLDWLRDDLRRASGSPTLVLQHEPCIPPTFLDAPRVAAIVSATPHVVGVLHGHLHYDMEFRLLKPHIVAPALGPNDRHGFKVYDVHPDVVIGRSWYADPTAARGFRPSGVYNRIDIPGRLRIERRGEATTTALRVRDPRPIDLDDSTLRARWDTAMELLGMLEGALERFGG